MQAAESMPIWDFLRQSEFRFYQQRDLGLDLYFTGIPGIALAVLLIASAVVFLLAIFHVVPLRKHVVAILLSLGAVAALTGFFTTYWHVENLPEFEAKFADQRGGAGPIPNGAGQWAAVVALPLLIGLGTCVANVCGCLYMTVFWVTGKR